MRQTARVKRPARSAPRARRLHPLLGMLWTRSRWIGVGKLRLHMRVAEGPWAPGRMPVVLVHGPLMASRSMARLVETLGPHAPTYAPDLPGFGRSDATPHPLEIRGLAETLIRFMDAAGLEHAVLLGHSFGCQVAVEAAARHPERVERLVLQAPTLLPADRSVGRQVVRLAVNALREDPGLWPLILQDGWQSGLRQARHALRLMRTAPLEAQLSQLAMPALVLSGDRDGVAPLAWGRQVAERLPAGEHSVLRGATHTAVWTAPQQVARAVREFLADRPTAEVTPPVQDPTPAFIANEAASSHLLRATAHAIEGESAPSGLGSRPALHRLHSIRDRLQGLAGWRDALPEEVLRTVRLEQADQWMLAQYPRWDYPAAFIGASNGSAVHLAAALGAPWLAQTLSVPVRSFQRSVDDVQAAFAWGKLAAGPLLAGNPDWQLHHMHDPAQAHGRARRSVHFHVKRRRLGAAWERFLSERLAPGSVIFLVECAQRWSGTRVSDRHVFQLGGWGAPEPRVAWEPPTADVLAPDAEWGFEETLRADVERFAKHHGYRLRRLRFSDPDALSPTVAELYRDWYRELGVTDSPLIVDAYSRMDPFQILRTHAVPYAGHAAAPASDPVQHYLAQWGGSGRVLTMDHMGQPLRPRLPVPERLSVEWVERWLDRRQGAARAREAAIAREPVAREPVARDSVAQQPVRAVE